MWSWECVRCGEFEFKKIKSKKALDIFSFLMQKQTCSVQYLKKLSLFWATKTSQTFVYHNHQPGFECCNCYPGRVDLEGLRPVKHLWVATVQQYGNPSGTNSCWFCALRANQWYSSSSHTLFSRMTATDFSTSPSSDRWTAHLWGLNALVFSRDAVCRGWWGGKE